MAAAPAVEAPTNPKLDIYSPEFDPREALLCVQLSVPYPRVQPLNNLAECRRLLPPDAPDALPEAALLALHRAAEGRSSRGPLTARTEAAPAGEQPNAASVPRSRRSRAGREVASRFTQGPLQLVRSLVGKRVCVVTRHRNCVRSRCTGTLIAADRHLNLLLLDAEDVYVPANEAAERVGQTGEFLDASAAIAQAVLAPAAGEMIPHSETLIQPMRRRFGQVLLRGEGIVLVYAAP